MRTDHGDVRTVPATYAKKRPDAAYIANRYILEWEGKRLEAKEKVVKSWCPPTICFSRKIGGGALEIADILSERFGFPVVDREILEYIASKARLNRKTVAAFDERYPGKLAEFLSLAFGEKAFINSDYARHLFRAVFSIAALRSTIFVGRGVHLLLPRERVLAVRIICSTEYRIKRLAGILRIGEAEAERELDKFDKEQRAFYKKVYGRRDASPYEFDLVVNCDGIGEASQVADIVAQAFVGRFGDEAGVIPR